MHGMLVDWQIISLGLVSPLRDNLVQPVSVDLTLGHTAAALRIDPGAAPTGFMVGQDAPEYDYYAGWNNWTLPPGGLVLFQTAETISLPNNIAGKFEGKSSLGRIGLMTHITAGFIDPGFHGVLTLEVYNCGPLTLVLRPGVKIGQVSFTALEATPNRAYGDPDLGSHYQGADTVQGGRF